MGIKIHADILEGKNIFNNTIYRFYLPTEFFFKIWLTNIYGRNPKFFI